MADEDKDQDMIAGLTADEHRALHDGLSRLPDTMPPRIVWERIQEQAEAEGLLKSAPRHHWYLGSGIAAALVVAAIVLLPANQPAEQLPTAMTVPDSMPTNETSVNALQALMVESRQLEENLRALPAEPRVTRAGTAATISELQDRIAAIDYQLSRTDGSLTPEQEQILWRERVRMMRSLVGLRYAQSQRVAF